MKALLHRTLRRLGYDIRHFQPGVFPEAQLMALLRAQGVNLLLDVGANAGHFGIVMRQNGYSGRIVSFEPLAAAWEQLCAASGRDDRWEVAERMAIGDRDGETDLHVSANSASSSVLEMLDAHLHNAPNSGYIGSERVPLRRLDSIAAPYLRPESVTLLKVDTQGFEDRVLDGATGILPSIAGIHLELSLVPLYAGQKLMPEMLERLHHLGFDLWGIWPVLVAPDSARLLQVDATFFRSPRSMQFENP